LAFGVEWRKKKKPNLRSVKGQGELGWEKRRKVLINNDGEEISLFRVNRFLGGGGGGRHGFEKGGVNAKGKGDSRIHTTERT